MKLGILLFASIVFSLSNVSIFHSEKKETEGLATIAAFSPYDEPNYKTGISTSLGGPYKQKDLMFDRMNVSNTWDTYKGDKVKVAVIDTGIYSSHEDFNGTNISPRSYDTYNNTYTLSDGHSGGHGSVSAACIAASINGVGGLGMAPNVELFVYRASTNTGGFYTADINEAINRAIDDHVDIINLSIQGYSSVFNYSYVEDYDGVTYSGKTQISLSKSSLQTAITKAYNHGITVVAAAGNYNTTNDSFPGANDHVICVGSTSLTSDTTKSGYSNYGSYVDVVAPGYVVVPNITATNKYELWWGTSFSAPLVTGAIALYKSKYPSATPDQIEARLKATCDPLAYSGSGSGKVNVANFLNNGVAESWVDVSGISLPSTFEMAEGVSETLVPTFTPSNATRKTCYWSSSDTSVATVDQFGIVTSKKLGTTNITATSVDGGYSSTCTITVGEYIAVQGITLSPHELSLSVGQTHQLSWTFTPANPTDTDVVLLSMDDEVATVTDDGLVTAIGEGTTTIGILTDDGYYEDYCEVTVTDDRAWNLVTDESELVVGEQYIFVERESTYAAKEMKGDYFNGNTITLNTDKTVVTNISSSYQFTLGGDSSSGWTFANSSNRLLGCSGAKKVNVSSNGTTTWTISIDSSALATIYSTNRSYGRILYNYNNGSPRFTTYTSNLSDTMKLISLYRFGSINYESKAIVWANTFTTELTCNNGVTPPSKSKWSELATSYGNLSNESKYYFENATYSLNGSVVTPLDDTNEYIAEAVARYDYIVAKYVENDYPRFMDRTVDANPKISMTLTDTRILIVVSSLSLLFMTSCAGFLYIRKRRKEI